jgi:hypothetical protein
MLWYDNELKTLDSAAVLCPTKLLLYIDWHGNTG